MRTKLKLFREKILTKIQSRGKYGGIALELTNKCQLDCLHCHRSRIKQRDIGQISLDTLKIILESPIRRFEMGLCGDPFMHNQILDVLEMMSQYSKFYIFFSNILRIDNDICKKLKKLNHLIICTPHYLQRNNNKIVERPQHLDKFYKNILVLNDNGINFEINELDSVLIKEFVQEIKDRLNAMHINKKIAIKPYENFHRLNKINQPEEERRYFKGIAANPYCYGDFGFSINQDGKVFLCCADFARNLGTFADFKTDTFEEIVSRYAAIKKNARKGSYITPCDNCWKRKKLGSGSMFI